MPNRSTSSAAVRRVAVSSRPIAMAPVRPNRSPATAARSAAGTISSIAPLIAKIRSSSGSLPKSSADSPKRFNAFAAGPAPVAALPRRKVMASAIVEISPIETPANSPARSSTCMLLTVVPSDWASLACASMASRLRFTVTVPMATIGAVMPTDRRLPIFVILADVAAMRRCMLFMLASARFAPFSKAAELRDRTPRSAPITADIGSSFFGMDSGTDEERPQARIGLALTHNFSSGFALILGEVGHVLWIVNGEVN
ncbi:hypothetical protein [Sulfitobacter sp. HI0027]|uniref:hypothetical protein n=1 Tax=Sulfitobacter sp. HI0027 TaxID=1822226 RepID=UPI00123790E0|nr:hypothetical protein [Sulfitobacter sp. HI0027]